MKIIQFLALSMLFWSISSCGTDGPIDKPITPPPPKVEVEVPNFNRDSAYAYVAKQVSFGPRVPQTATHAACGDWLVSKFNSFGWKVQEQKAAITGPDGKPLNIRNIIASLNPEKEKRVLLCAHWDTRSIADQDTARQSEPILGADDGGSGVGILLELARVIGQKGIDLGLDIVLFDAEDQGESGGIRGASETWCLGAQYWSRHLHPMTQKPAFGILLDMAGFSHARFYKEGVSRSRAPNIQEAVWAQAGELGYNDLFREEYVQEIIDDHLFVNDLAKIPTIDIINLRSDEEARKNGRRFGFYWHTHRDNMDVIGIHTLNAVGRTLILSLYKHEKGALL